MTVRHVYTLLGDADPLVAPTSSDVIVLRQGSTHSARLLEDSLWRELARADLQAPSVAVDFYRLAATVFSADLRTSRATAFDRWQRRFLLHVPVADPDLWRAATPLIQGALGFLSGDTWDFDFRKAPAHHPWQTVRTLAPHRTASKVCLLSGGLDSFAGAVDQIVAGADLICVSHNAAGSATFSSPAQGRALARLQTIRGPSAVSLIKASVSPPIRISHESEPTQRSRSIMFLGLGVLVAAALGKRRGGVIPLVIPENGFISLNVPLTSGRLGSLSTRTTHPYFIDGVQRLLGQLGIPVSLELPYQFATKGQMLIGSANRSVLAAGARETVSCAHPAIRRFHIAEANHCGYCVPCIIRRAAMSAARLDDPADYAFDVQRDAEAMSVGQRRDLRAFQMAIGGRAAASSRAAVLAVAPIPGGPDAIRQSLDVYERGLDEVAAFLRGR